MSMQTSSWGDFLDGVSARISEIIDDTADLTPSFLGTGLWKSIKSDSLKYNTEGVSGLNYLEIFDEGDSIKEDETSPQYNTSYVMKQYGKIVSISQMLSETRPSELEAKLDEIKQLRISANRSLNKHAWQVLVDGFSTTDSDSGLPISRLSDAVALFSTAHPSRVAGVSNRSNRLASDAILSESNLFTAMKIIREQRNGRGLPMGYEGGFTLVVPPALEKKAQEITKSELQSNTGNNDLNFYKGIIDMISSVYIGAVNSGSDTAWYLFANSPEELSMRYVHLIEPKIAQDVDFNTKAIRVSIDGAWAMGYSNWEFSAASDGTND